MRTALTAFISAASLCTLATAASAQVAPMFPFGGPTPYPYAGSAPTMPSNTGAPLYSYHRTTAQPGAVGSCSIIAGNRVCSAVPAGTDNPAPGYGYGYGYGGLIGALIAAPVNAAGAVVAAPFGAMGATTGTMAAGTGYTYPPATGTPPYSYESQVGLRRAAIGHCDLIAGNRVCSAGP
jgi:hypothetical protein